MAGWCEGSDCGRKGVWNGITGEGKVVWGLKRHGSVRGGGEFCKIKNDFLEDYRRQKSAKTLSTCLKISVSVKENSQ